MHIDHNGWWQRRWSGSRGLAYQVTSTGDKNPADLLTNTHPAGKCIILPSVSLSSISTYANNELPLSLPCLASVYWAIVILFEIRSIFNWRKIRMAWMKMNGYLRVHLLYKCARCSLWALLWCSVTHLYRESEILQCTVLYGTVHWTMAQVIHGSEFVNGSCMTWVARTVSYVLILFVKKWWRRVEVERVLTLI